MGADGKAYTASCQQCHTDTAGLQGKKPKHEGQPGDHGAFLAVVFPHDQMQILAYNRIVRDPRGRSPAQLLQALQEILDVEPAAEPRPDHPLDAVAVIETDTVVPDNVVVDILHNPAIKMARHVEFTA